MRLYIAGKSNCDPQPKSTSMHHCNQCDFSSTIARTLEMHLIKHSHERPYKCEYCNTDYKMKAHLIRHQNSKDCKKRQMKYECKLCNTIFTSKTKLIAHLRCHFPKTEEDVPEASFTDEHLFQKYGQHTKI